jgi:hypothetical protein
MGPLRFTYEGRAGENAPSATPPDAQDHYLIKNDRSCFLTAYDVSRDLDA